ncbi:MAG: hypothetical protein PWQ57_2006 [Desulfovibrionales bacterium]|nr:hypothetical protein [Desulfovibrionales bacterium]
MSTYFAAVYNDEDGYNARFPDLPGCITQADTLGELDAMLRDALFCYLDALREDGDGVPQPRSYGEILAAAQAEEDAENLAFVTMVSIPDKVKRVRVNISLPETDLALIDRAASARSLDRSAFLAMAAKQVAQGECEAS